jgi:hypothetical protein
MRIHRLLPWLIVLLGTHATGASAAERIHALLVGVSEYPALDQQMWLSGPRNDVALYRDLLLDRGLARQDIIVLADGLEGAADPGRQAVMDALDALAGKVAAGDFVFMLFAGHGSQQPARAGDDAETDGLDEIFLPRDIGRWDGERAAVPNAITDNELGTAIERIRERGAFVWAVFDNCHSGTITRAMPAPGERDRQLKPEALGIDPATLAAAQARAAGERTRGGPQVERGLFDASAVADGRGGFVAFYAAQSQETTPEASLPLYAADARPRGLFSYTLYQVLATHPGASYRQTIEQVLQTYQGMGRQQPTPTYEGSSLDAPVFGAATNDTLLQWRLEKDGANLKLRAGLLQQVTPDSILAVVPSPTAKDSDRIGYVRVTEAGSAGSVVQPVAWEDVPAFDIAALKGSAYARPVDLKIDFTLRVAAPAGSAVCEAPAPALQGALTELKSAQNLAPRVRWVGSNDAADVRLCQYDGRVLFLDGAAAFNPAAPGHVAHVTIPPEHSPSHDGEPTPLARELGLGLVKIARVANLSRLSASVGAPSRLQLELKLSRDCAAGTASDQAAGNTAGEAGCEPQPVLLTPTTRATVHDGDRLAVRVVNPSTQPFDVTVLYIDAQYGITAMYPDVERGELPRIEPAGQVQFEITANAEPAGFERMLIIGVPVTPQSPPASFTGLAQSGLASAVQRGASPGGLVALFEEAAFGSEGQGTTRGAPRRSGAAVGAAEITTFLWDVVP